MEEIILKYSDHHIFKIFKTIQIICFISILILTYLVMVTDNKKVLHIWGFVVLSLLCLGIMIISKMILKKLITAVFLDKIDLKRYSSLVNESYRNARKSSRGSMMQETYLADAQVKFLRGNFQDALQSLESINLEKLSLIRRRKLRNTINYYSGLCHIYLNNESIMIEGFPPVLSEIKSVLDGKVTSYFNTVKSKSKLEEITFTYYRALNQVNQGNSDQAKAYFQEISNENPELFYVCEAKKFLEEN